MCSFTLPHIFFTSFPVCRAGHYVNGINADGATCQQCPTGTYSEDGTAANGEDSCTPCPSEPGVMQVLHLLLRVTVSNNPQYHFVVFSSQCTCYLIHFISDVRHLVIYEIH